MRRVVLGERGRSSDRGYSMSDLFNSCCNVDYFPFLIPVNVSFVFRS